MRQPRAKLVLLKHLLLLLDLVLSLYCATAAVLIVRRACQPACQQLTILQLCQLSFHVFVSVMAFLGSCCIALESVRLARLNQLLLLLFAMVYLVYGVWYSTRSDGVLPGVLICLTGVGVFLLGVGSVALYDRELSQSRIVMSTDVEQVFLVVSPANTTPPGPATRTTRTAW